MQTREALGVGIPATQAEAVRQRLLSEHWLDHELVPQREGALVWFALAASASESRVRAELTDSALQIARRPFEARPLRARSYQDLLTDLPPDLREILPSSFDIVGHVAILKLDEPLLPHQDGIARAVLTAQPRVETVALDAGVEGEHRVRDLSVIGGRPDLSTVHREHGLEIEIDLATTYFSPRLATERLRLSRRITPGARVLDLFAGVGAFVCLVGRDRAPAAVLGIDINPAAVRCLGSNLRRNRIPPHLVGVVQGDARSVAPRTHDWDHVVMNLPHGAFGFLDVAADCVAPQGEIHLYAMVERDDASAYRARACARLEGLTGRPWHVAETRHVRTYAPTMDGLGYTLAPMSNPK